MIQHRLPQFLDLGYPSPHTYTVKPKANKLGANRYADFTLSKRYFHPVTLSALASMFDKIVDQICFAVFGLITSSNLVGCSMGKSPGMATLGSSRHTGHAQITVRRPAP
jgi:hypothetical protein